MGRKVVAVIDNDPSILRALERLLTAHAFDVQCFVSGEAFLGRDPQKKLTCLVLDIHLDGMSGFQLRRQLTDLGQTLPVIFLTASDSQETEREAIAAGCVGFLRKPFRASSLMDAIVKASGS